MNTLKDKELNNSPAGSTGPSNSASPVSPWGSDALNKFYRKLNSPERKGKYRITIHWKENIPLRKKLLAIFHFSYAILFGKDGGWVGNAKSVDIDYEK